jgi:hypothetical protein
MRPAVVSAQQFFSKAFQKLAEILRRRVACWQNRNALSKGRSAFIKRRRQFLEPASK